MAPKVVSYEFAFADGEILRFIVELQRERGVARPDAPAWTRLDYHKCSVCPLTSETTSHCPAALDVETIIEGFKSGDSTDQVDVVVKTAERTYSNQCKADDAIHSLLALVMVTSGCPILSMLEGLAYFHLPFASTDEIFFHTISFYLLKQYREKKAGGVPDLELEGLYEFFRELEQLNSDFCERIRDACESDANLNAMVRLYSISQLLTHRLKKLLNEFESE
jgi:hypothetical protein